MAVTLKRTGGMNAELSFSTKLAPEKVYDYLSYLPRHAEWAGTISTLTQTSEGPPGVGTTYRTEETMRSGGGMKAATFCEITALERPRRIAWKARTDADRGPLAMRSEWEFLIEPEGGGSRVTQRVAFHPPGLSSRIMGAIFVPFADLIGGMGASPKMIKKNMENLQRKLDEMAGSTGVG